MKTFGYKRTVDLNKFDLNSVEKEYLKHKAKVSMEVNANIKKCNISDKEIVKSVSKEMITAINNWQR